MFKHRPGAELDLLDYTSREYQYGSDHRPVIGIFQATFPPPFIGTPPLYLRPSVPEGLFRIMFMELEYNFAEAIKIPEHMSLLNPMEINICISADFLNNNPTTSSIPVTLCEVIVFYLFSPMNLLRSIGSIL